MICVVYNLSEKRYIKHNVTKEWLKSNGFRHNRIFSDEENEAFTYRFPVYKYGDFATLDCEIIILFKTGEVRINVYDYNTRDRYAPFYNCEYGNYDKVLIKINEKIDKELGRLNIREDNNNGSKGKKNKK